MLNNWRDVMHKYFVDLRVMTILMCIWLGIVMMVLMELEVFSRSKFVSFGPRPDLTFMHVSIDTYYKYNILILMIVFHTFITDLIADSLVPHVLNFVQVPSSIAIEIHSTHICFPQDTKNKYIPHKAATYYYITSAWSIYCSFTQLFVIFIAFGQLDLLLFRLASDLAANYFTLGIYLHGKIHDPEMHATSNKNPQHDPQTQNEEDSPVTIQETLLPEQESTSLLHPL